MKKSNNFSVRAFLLALVFFALPVIWTGAATAAEDGKDFCWKDSQPRGVGTIPDTCRADEERIGLLCYKQCKPGMKRFGFDCHSVCPAGMENQGLFCRAAEYGRGGGYPWEFGDSLNDSGMYARCHAANGQGNCEKQGLIVYAKCKPGYINIGLICRPKQPDCAALNMGGQLDLSCAKKVEIGNPVTGQCGANQDKDAGLCYKKCSPGYNGIGPVCWGKPPTSWVECGMGAAKDSTTCGKIVFGQVASVAQVAVFIASFGSSSAVTTAGDAAQTANNLEKLQASYKTMKAQYDLFKKSGTAAAKRVVDAEKSLDAANKGRKGYVAMDTADSAVTDEDMIRMAAQISGILDPTGVSDTVAAYTYPKCSKYFPATSASASTPVSTTVAPVAAPAAAGGKISWVAASNGQIPAGAIIGGQETGRNLAICRAKYSNGVHPGKVVASNCNIGYGGKEVTIPNYEVAVGAVSWVAASNGQIPAGAVIGGQESGRNLAVCRANYQNGVHPGKVVASNCNIGYGGKEVTIPKYEVAVTR